GHHELVFKNRYAAAREVRHGLGWMYHAVSNVLGFGGSSVETCDAGKTMGLAPYGRPAVGLLEPWIQVRELTLDFSGFERWLRGSGWLPAALCLPGSRPFSMDGDEFTGAAADLAYKAQIELETALVALARALRERSGAPALCLAGGVALNSVANERIRAEAGFDDVFIVPAAHDAGQALGLAYYGHLALRARAQGSSFPRSLRNPEAFDGSSIVPIVHAYGGRTWDPEGIEALLEASGLDYLRCDSVARAGEHAAAAIASGKIVGWFQAGSEYGPRSLGHRSILADARDASMKDTLNQRVKFREAFRPFAPSVLERAAGEVFELEGASPYMLRVVRVRPAWRERVPAITHVDGTARVQTLSAAANPALHGLVSAFERLTGVPLVLNTSFNLRGMPIVESPWDALHCFLFTDMDGLYLDRFYVPAPDPAKLVFSINEGWSLALQHGLDTTDPATLVTRSPRGKTHSHPVSLRTAALLAELDDVRSLSDLSASAGTAERERLLTDLQALGRSACLRLRTGRLYFPIHTSSLLSANEATTLVQRAGMVSAHLIDR
ncbi:MAG TPA: carbamoyltransferase C-terminal domain-containing protein, partial [Polyangiaceae bacterium]|nr:carbamoyltransferase C-terminal domain-containing protein [Polyangiaceae bacterium]